MGPRSLVLLSALCFGTTGTAQALGPDGTEPSVVGAARVAVGGALLALLAWRRGGAAWPALPVLLGAVGVAAYQLTFFAAVDATGVAVGTVVALGSGPVFAGVLAREPLTARWAVATGLAVTGVAVLVAAGTSAEIDPGGILLALGAGLSYATYTVAAKRLLAHHEPEAVMARLFGIGAVLLAPVLIVNGLGEVATAGGIALALYLGAVPTALAYVLFARGLRHLPANEVATLTLAEPVTATMLGVVVLAERPGPIAGLGVALVLAGLAVLATPRRRQPAVLPA
jgi:drug/metabolite transporter, DME family